MTFTFRYRTKNLFYKYIKFQEFCFFFLYQITATSSGLFIPIFSKSVRFSFVKFNGKVRSCHLIVTEKVGICMDIINVFFGI